jgi:hypothetical protein
MDALIIALEKLFRTDFSLLISAAPFGGLSELAPFLF